MIFASGGGSVKKIYSGSALFTFPIGDNSVATEYSPIDITPSAATDITVSVSDAKHPNNASTTNFLTRYWSITPSSNITAAISGTYIATASDINGGSGAGISAAQFYVSFFCSSNQYKKFLGLSSSIPILGAPTFTFGP